MKNIVILLVVLQSVGQDVWMMPIVHQMVQESVIQQRIHVEIPIVLIKEELYVLLELIVISILFPLIVYLDAWQMQIVRGMIFAISQQKHAELQLA